MNEHKLVLIPGQLSTARMWLPVAAALQNRAAVSIADQNRAGADNVADIARDVFAQCPPRFALAAHGMSGFIAFEMLRQDPSRITALTLAGTLAPADNEAQTARRQRYLELVRAGKFAEIIDERIPVVVHPARRGSAEVEGVVRQMAIDTGAETFVRQTRAIMGRPDSRPTLATIGCPTVLVWGRQDGMATEAHQAEMHQSIRGASLEVLEDTGHFCSLERPAKVAEIIGRLLESI